MHNALEILLIFDCMKHPLSLSVLFHIPFDELRVQRAAPRCFQSNGRDHTQTQTRTHTHIHTPSPRLVIIAHAHSLDCDSTHTMQTTRGSAVLVVGGVGRRQKININPRRLSRYNQPHPLTSNILRLCTRHHPPSNVASPFRILPLRRHFSIQPGRHPFTAALFGWQRSGAQTQAAATTAASPTGSTTPLTTNELEPLIHAYLTSISHHQSHAQAQQVASFATQSHESTSQTSDTPDSASAPSSSSSSQPQPPHSPASHFNPSATTGTTHGSDHQHPHTQSHPHPHPHPDPSQDSTYYSHAVASLLANLHSIPTRSNIRHLILAGLGVIGVTGILLYVFRDPLKANLSEQTADVAKRSLTSSEVQMQVNMLSAEVVRKLLNDPVIMANCLSFLQTLFAAPETKASLGALLQATLKDEQNLHLLSAFASALLADVLSKPETLAQLIALLRSAIQEPGNEMALQVLFKKFVDDPNTQKMVADIAKRAALDVLNDETVKETAIAFLKSVTSDASVQKSTGDALWNAVKYTLRPAWLSHVDHAAQQARKVEAVASAAAGMQTADVAQSRAVTAAPTTAVVVPVATPVGQAALVATPPSAPATPSSIDTTADSSVLVPVAELTADDDESNAASTMTAASAATAAATAAAALEAAQQMQMTKEEKEMLQDMEAKPLANQETTGTKSAE